MNREILLVSCLFLLALAAGVALFYVLDDAGDDGIVPDEQGISQDDFGVKSKDKARRQGDRVAYTSAAAGGADRPKPGTAGEPLQLGRGETTLEGYVIGGDGKPVADALASVFEDRSDTASFTLQGVLFGQVLTDASGRFRFQGAPSDEPLLLRVDHEEFATWSQGALTLSDGQTKSLKIKLQRGLSLQGSVLDLAGNPLPDASIIVVDQNTRAIDPTRTVERIAVSDARGEFSFNNLTRGIKKVTASKAGYASVSRVSINLAPRRDVAPLSFVLETGAVIRGRVVDQDGMPIASVVISAEPIRRRTNNVPAGNYPPVKSDENGEFVMEGLLDGMYRLACYKKGFGSSRRQNAKTGAEAVQIEMKRRPVVRGRIVDAESGQPIKKFSVVLGRSENLIFTSNQSTQRFESEDGSFEFSDLVLKGEFYLFAEARGYAWSRSDLILTSAEEDIDGILISLIRGAKVRGRITNTAGKPIAGAQVELIPRQQQQSGDAGMFLGLIQASLRTAKRRARTNDKGEYEFENVHAGSFVTKARHSKFAAGEHEELIFVDGKSDARMPDLQLMQGGTLKGIVLEKDGKSGADCLIQISPKAGFGGGGKGSYSTRSDAQGRFIVKSIRPGIYNVQVSERNGEVAQIFEQMLLRKKREEIIIGDGETQEIRLR
ncbi:MAG: carboxypeptidase-like regulatory domain-containing protein [Planctomycetota bacterium]